MNGRPGSGHYSWWEGGPPPRLVVRSALRALGFTIGLVAIYYVLPFDRISTWPAVGMLAIGLLALVVLIVRRL